MSIKPTFLYHAQGCAFGGVMRRPNNEVLEAKAATALPQTGGVAFADETGFNYKNLFTFDKAATRASGTKDGNGTYKTTITATVEGLNMQGVVKATSIVASLTTRHNGSEDEAHVDPSGSQFTGLTISGYPVTVDLDIALDVPARHSERLPRQVRERLWLPPTGHRPLRLGWVALAEP